MSLRQSTYGLFPSQLQSVAEAGAGLASVPKPTSAAKARTAMRELFISVVPKTFRLHHAARDRTNAPEASSMSVTRLTQDEEAERMVVCRTQVTKPIVITRNTDRTIGFIRDMRFWAP